MQSIVRPIAFSLLGCSVLAGVGAASGQSLSDRINHVMQERSRAEARNTSKSHLLSVLLYTDISVQFRETRLRDVIDYFQNILGIPIVGRYLDDRTGMGLDPEAPITLDAANQPALTVLERVLEMGSDFEPTTWQLREGFVEVGTKARLSAPNARQVRYYMIKDLLFEPPYFDNAPQFNLNQALQQGGGGGRGGGGGGGGRGGGGGGGGGLGGGGGGGGAGGGGGLFGTPGAEGDRMTEAERAQMVVDIIVDTIEPEAWEINGGEYASIRYYQGTLIIRAPDYIHRQIGGYPFPTRPVTGGVSAAPARRYMTFAGGPTNVALKSDRSVSIGGDIKAGGDHGGNAPDSGDRPEAP